MGPVICKSVSTLAIGATKNVGTFIDVTTIMPLASKLAGDTHTQSIVAEALQNRRIETVMFKNYDVMVDKPATKAASL